MLAQPTTRWRRIILLLSLVAGYGSAQTVSGPDSLAGGVIIVASGFRQTNRCKAFRLDVDGSAMRLFSTVAQRGQPTHYDPPASGTYTFTPTGEDGWAELRLSLQEDAGGKSADDQFLLRIQTESSGWVAPITSIAYNRFALLSQSDDTPLQNTALRSTVSPGENVTVGGVAGSQGSWMLLRAVGPTLAEFGVSTPLAQPTFQVQRKNEEMLPVSDWRTDPIAAESLRRIAALLGAFPLSEEGADAACFTWVSPGPFLLQCTNHSDESGEVLLEIYPLPPGLGNRD